nr:MAG TPA: hypothetical protein [Caudoviricetes sp.]DAV96516.1 MAG TPA: hypothetical protein [Caudoviricetes sp.]
MLGCLFPYYCSHNWLDCGDSLRRFMPLNIYYKLSIAYKT